MDLSYLAASPGGGTGSRWLDASMRRRRRLSSPSPACFLTPAFDATAGCGGSSGSSLSSGGLDLELDDSLLRFRRPRFSPSASPSSSLQRPLLLGFPPPQAQAHAASPAGEGEVLVMDGVMVGGGGGHSSKCQGAHGKEEPQRMRLQAMKTKSSEMDRLNARPVPGAENITQTSIPPSLSAQAAANPVKLAADLRPPVATALTTGPEFSTPIPEAAELSPRAVSSWPPSEEEDADISQVLYGPSSVRRLPIFREICPE